MRLKDCGRNFNLRKVYLQTPGLLMIGIDIGKSCHAACFGTQNGVLAKQFEFANSKDGFKNFERIIRTLRFKAKCQRVLIGMEPLELYWYGLYERLKAGGFSLCLVNCLALKNNRRTTVSIISKTDPKDTHSVFDLLMQAKFFLPVERDAELAAAYRLMRRYMAVNKRISRLRNQIRVLCICLFRS